MVYEDFVIQVGGRREDGHTVQVLKSPAGEGRSSFKLALSLAEINTILTPRGGDVRGAPEGEPVDGGRDLRAPASSEPLARLAAQQVGDQLFRGLFSGQVKSLYDQSLGTISSRAGCGLRIKLKFDAQDQELAQLISVPWEFLWRGETHDFLSLSRLSPVVRYLDVPRPVAPILLESVLRVLVVISSPPGLPALDVEQERANLEAACRSWKGVEITVLERADSAAIRRHLLEKPFHVFHFIGHGGFDPEEGEGVLFFERPDGQPEPVTGQALATFLKDFKTLGLVFLNACDTARTDSSGVNPFSGVAGALVLGGLPAVVAMQFPISDRAAIAFSTAFYQRLAIGDPVDASVVEGRQAILAAVPGKHEWGTPVLFLRVPDGTVFQTRTSSGEASQGRRWRWPKVLLAVLLAALLVVLGMPVFEKLSDRLAGRQVLEIEQEFGSSVSGLSGVLATAELQPNGRMRLHFRFRNTAAKAVGVGFDYRSTYLADGAGNEYKVLATDATAERAVDSIPPGGEIERWLEFPAPLDRAQKFHVALAGRGPAKVQFPFFTVNLPGYPPELSRSTPVAKPAPDALALAVSRSIATSVAGFKGELRGVELRKDGRMRWSFDFLNGSNRDQPIGFDYSAIYLVDEHGNRYPVLGSDTGGQPGQVFRNRVPRAVRRGYWFDFPAPRNGARSFTVVLASPDKTGLRFIPFDVRVPFYPPEYAIQRKPSGSLPLTAKTETVSKPKEAPPLAPPPPPQKTTADAPPPAEVQEAPAKPAAKPAVEPPKSVTHTAGLETFETSIDGLTGRLAAVEGVGDGRLRWTVVLVNESGRTQTIGFDVGETYLSDNLGHRYGVLRMDRSDSVFHDNLPAGASVVHWFDFAAPAKGARRFFVVLASHDLQELRYSPFEVTLPGPK
ncbi:MAG TPA: CHAT domain-containing protein [Thermoanaerobaculia bacterium]|nr:CHAT domain-containing protein [Thermoanaerobaculia bacterium]